LGGAKHAILEVLMRLDGSHPVASVAARLCRSLHDHTPSWEDVACPECWETALIADKEAAAEAGLPEVCEADPELVDEVAVERAVAGKSVELTVAEWQAAKLALMQRRQVGLCHARYLLSRTVTVVDALGSPLDPRLLGQVSGARSFSPARVVTLAARTRARRQASRREAFTAGLVPQAA
jgi:hypothetical protein